MFMKDMFVYGKVCLSACWRRVRHTVVMVTVLSMQAER
jgi:hypothetical protein